MNARKEQISVAVCVSGMLGLTGLKTLMRLKSVRIAYVLTNGASTGIIAYARSKGLTCMTGNPREARWAERLPRVDVLASINYIYLLPSSIFIKSRRLSFNIHDSLLPTYMGRTPNTWAIIHDEVETGITAHEINGECDSGDIIFQEKIAITNTETGGSLLLKMKARYPHIIKTVIRMALSGQVPRRPQALDKRSYFGKREPADGQIDFRWSARKVYNWVRAQTKPYPGAYYYANGKKVTIWEAQEEYAVDTASHPIGHMFTLNKKQYIKCGQGAIRVKQYE